MHSKAPRLTARMEAAAFSPGASSGYIFAGGPEERAAHVEAWRSASGVVLLEIVEQGRDRMVVAFSGGREEVQLRSESSLRAVCEALPGRVYLDITGLSHHVWAPLLRALLVVGRQVMAVYVEPGGYTRAQAPTEGVVYDLSEKISGIAPLPGFARLDAAREDDCAFVPLLGFEGTRLIHVSEHVQAPPDATYPVVGVPGFRVEYPFVSLLGNRKPLHEGRYWTNARFATANCPFDLFFTLRKILRDCDRPLLRVAPIGTKPHGLGAVLFALAAPGKVELIYDHPIRKPNRTVGTGRLCLYDIATFVGSDEYRGAAQ